MATGGPKERPDKPGAGDSERGTGRAPRAASGTRPKRSSAGARTKAAGAGAPAGAKASGARTGTAKRGGTGTRARKGTAARASGAPARAAKGSPEAVARSYFAAVQARDADAMSSHWSPEGVDDVVPFGVLRGPGEVREFFAQFFAAIPDLDTTVDRVVADERVASLQWRMRGTFDGAPFRGIEPTGRWIELRGVDVIEVEDGRIVRNSAYYDGMTFAREIGMLPQRDSQAERALFAAFNAVTKVRERLAAR